MKRFSFAIPVSFIVCASLMTGACFAQPSNVHFGLKAGVNIASLKVEDGADLDSKTSFNAGGLAHIHVTKHFAVQPELLVSGQGGKYNAGSSTGKLNLTYLNIPVLAQYMFGDGFRLETGPQLGFLLSAKTKLNKVTVDVKDSYKTADFSWVFGAGYLSEMGLGVDLRYNLGLSNINDASSTNVQNRVFSLGLFYQFMHTAHK